MKNWMHDPSWEALIRRDKDHQYHVEAYWRARYAAIPGKPVPARGAGSSNNPPAFRYPSIKEDPTAYQLYWD